MWPFSVPSLCSLGTWASYNYKGKALNFVRCFWGPDLRGGLGYFLGRTEIIP